MSAGLCKRGIRAALVVTASGSDIRTKEVSLGFGTEPLGEFIDSDQAMREPGRTASKAASPAWR